MRTSTIISDIIQIINRKHSDLQGLDADDHLQYDRVDGTRHYIKNLLTTQGDLLIRGANGLERLPIGQEGQVLVSQGAGKNPIWGESPPSRSLVFKFVAGENIKKNKAVCIKSDGKIYETDANDSTRINFIGFALEDISENSEGKVLISGILDGFSNLSIGSIYYLLDKSHYPVIADEVRTGGYGLPQSAGDWQSFVATTSVIDSIDIFVGNGDSYQWTVYFQLKEGEGLGGNNVGPQFSATIGGYWSGWVRFVYSPGITVTPNSTYSIVVWGNNINLWWGYDGTNSYPYGRSSRNANHDFNFRVNVLTNGLIGTSPGTNSVKVGKAVSSDKLFVIPSL